MDAQFELLFHRFVMILIINIQSQINAHLSEFPETKKGEMELIHALILKAMPGCRLWFDDGSGDGTKAAINPTIGYGYQIMKYANGSTREFFQIGLSATKSGISVYILGLTDKKYLTDFIAPRLGKATVTGYCIKFKSVQDIDKKVLTEAIKYGVKATKVK